MNELSGNQKRKMRSASRLYAVQALFQMEHSGQSIDAVRTEFLDHRFGSEIEDGVTLNEGDVDVFTGLLEQAVNWQAKIDQMTDAALVEKWPLGRIDPTLRALFRAAGAELTLAETPPKVVISEFVDVAKSFYPDSKEPSFVNAVLDHMARQEGVDAL
ncbi:MAG: transcription antitermination factor NusB [Pseudomonadota bacterium]